jgi:hypothetical protein
MDELCGPAARPQNAILVALDLVKCSVEVRQYFQKPGPTNRGINSRTNNLSSAERRKGEMVPSLAGAPLHA